MTNQRGEAIKFMMAYRWELLIVIVIGLLVCSSIYFYSNRNDNSEHEPQLHKIEYRYGDRVEVKEGFYAGQTGRIHIKSIFGDIYWVNFDDDNIRNRNFDCTDLIPIEE